MRTPPPVYRPLAGSFGFLDGFIEQRTDATVASSLSAFGRDAETLRTDARQEIVRLVGEDGGHARALHYSVAVERTAVLAMHPRADVSSHYLVPALLDAGYAFMGVQSRYFNNDEDCLHEALLADVAAAMRFLRSRGYAQVVLLGNSGGGSLFALYQSMAETPPPGRPTHTPGGTPYDLNGLDLPSADGLLLLAAHLGEGKFLMNMIDPSVTDENDLLSCDPALDMYDPANGFRPLPEQSHYSVAFIDEYRAAQRARVARIDALARQQIEQKRRFSAIVGTEAFTRLPLRQQIDVRRRAEVGRFLLIARTDADPASCDLSLHPSSRQVGSLQGPRPDLQNYRFGYHGHCLTPEGWLSTWSGLSSRASLVDTIATVSVPTYVLSYSADSAVFPEHSEAVHKAAAADDKTLHHVDGDHYGVGAAGKARATEKVLDWLRHAALGLDLCIPRRHDRVLRLEHLRDGVDARVGPAVLRWSVPGDRDSAVVCHARDRLRHAPRRSRAIRRLRGSGRTQIDLDRHDRSHGHGTRGPPTCRVGGRTRPARRVADRGLRGGSVGGHRGGRRSAAHLVAGRWPPAPPRPSRPF
jgi:hypothetical protein